MCDIIYRKCTVCKIEKLANTDNFYKSKDRYLGLDYRCKECTKLRKDFRKNRYINMTEEQKKSKRESCKKYDKTLKGRSIQLCSSYRKHDMKKNRDFDLTSEDFLNVFNELCVYCDFQATGFDRIDNSIGHIKSNCVPCCKECNIARMDNFTHQEMFLIGKTIHQIKLKRINYEY